MQKITPVGKRILIKKKEDVYYPGTQIIIPEPLRTKNYKGYVIAVGKEVEEIKVGDLIQYADYAVPTEMRHEEEPHLLITVGDVLAIIHE
jgi:co-chaperonin GroES (HSP10)